MQFRILVCVLTAGVCGVTCLPASTDPLPLDPNRGTEPLPEISTDRPDFTEATDTITPRYMQLEGGLLAGRHAGATDVTAPSTLLRVGLTRIAELRWGSDGLVSESLGRGDHRENHLGAADAELGVKLRFREEHKYAPALALIAGVTLPLGSSYFSSGHADPLLNLCWSKSLPGDFDAGGNFNVEWDRGEGRREQAVSLTVGRKLGRGFRAFGEMYRMSPIDGDEASHTIAAAGVSKLLGRNAQLDLSVGHTLGAHTPSWFAGAGFAVRFAGPKLR